MNQLEIDEAFLPTTELSYRDYLLDHVNKVLKNDYVRTTTQADKSTEFQIKSGIRVDSFSEYDDGVKLTRTAKRVMFGYFGSEINRMLEATKEVEKAKQEEEIERKTGEKRKSLLTIHYHYNEKSKSKFDKSGNAFQSQYFPNLSPKATKQTELEKQITDLLYDENGNLLVEKLEVGLNPRLEELFYEYFESEFNNRVFETIQDLIQKGVFEYNEQGKVIPTNIDSDVLFSKYANIPINQRTFAIASDYLFNSQMQNIEYSKMFAGDPAYYKNMADYKKRIPATYSDGMTLRITKGNEHFNIAVIDSIYIPSPFIKELEKGLPENTSGKYKNINSTDAQAWITPARWKFLIESLGKWTKTHDSVHKKMFSSEPQQYTEKELKVAAQPLKGVYFYRDPSGKPVYLKYSQAVLTANLIKNSPLESMYERMLEQEIDELITLDGVKVGAIEPTTIHDKNGNLLENYTLNVQRLDNHGWKLQQDLPTKTFKQTDIGSQLQKNIFAGLLFNKDNNNFFLNDEFVTGQYIMDEIVKTVTGLTQKGLDSLKQEFEIDENYKIGNITKFYNSLVEGLEKRKGSENVVKALKAEVSIYGIPQSTEKLYNLFASIVNKRLIKIQTNGGSFIQMANFGFNYVQGTEQGVKWSPFAKEKIHEPLLYIDENGRKKVQPGGVLVPASMIAKHIPDWSTKKPEELFGYMNEEGEFVPGLIDQRIYENVIGYRIPNQGLASNDALHIVGILPENVGDTIVAYTGITTKTGSDFDIDKMFLMVPNFEANYSNATFKKAKEYINKAELTKEEMIEELIHEGYSEASLKIEENIEDLFIKNILFQESENTYRQDFVSEYQLGTVQSLEYIDDYSIKKGMQNRMIELYKAVLTNPDVYPSLMKPIDIDFIKDELNSLFKDTEDTLLYHFDPQVDTLLRYSFLGGKAGVGMEANSMVDINREGQLEINGFHIKWGLKRENGNQQLDAEYSEVLSKEDMDYYVKVMKPKNEKAFREELSRVKVSDSMTAIMNAFVDIAKDNYITKGNWAQSTTNAGNLLFRMGVHPLYVVNFLANPVIKQYIEFQSSLEGLGSQDTGNTQLKFKKNMVVEMLNDLTPEGSLITYGTAYLKHDKDINFDAKAYILESQLEEGTITQEEFELEVTKINNLRNSLIKKFAKELGLVENNEQAQKAFNVIKKAHDTVFKRNNKHMFQIFDREQFNLEYYRNQITSKNKNLEFQVDLLNAFNRLQEISKNVKKNVDVSKMDTDGMSKNPNSLFRLFNLRDQLVMMDAQKVPNSLGGFISKFNNTPLGAYNEVLENVLNIVKNNSFLFPQGVQHVQHLFNEISQDIHNNLLVNEELATLLEKEYHTYVMTNFFDLANNEVTDLIDNLPNRLQQFKENSKKKYFMLNELEVKVPKNSRFKSTITLNNRKKSQSYEKLFTDSWHDLMIENPKLAEDLIKYSFVTSGFKMNMNQFFTYIPHQYFVEQDFNQFINNFSKSNQFDFIDKFYMNNLENKKVVKKIFSRQVKDITYNNGKSKVPAENGFVMKDPGKAKYYVELQQTSNIMGDPTAKAEPRYYKLVGYNQNDQGIYVRVRRTNHKINNKELVSYGEALIPEIRNPHLAKNAELFEPAIRKLPVADRQALTVQEVVEPMETIQEETTSQKQTQEQPVEIFEGFWTREEVKNQEDKIFLFGDNTNDRVNTKYVPSSTQAVIRGLPNALGIDTKKNRGTSKDSYFTDADFNEFKQHVDTQIQQAKNSGKTIVIPADGIGTGKAMLQQKAPKLFEYLEQELNKLKTQEQPQQQGQLSLFSQELFENNKEIFENNGVTEEIFNQMLEEFGQQYVEDYLKKCK